ncbi:MAG: galactose mutarotase [Lachnospiraceae bacterium]|nr:galactose mutarotase [Candidatus Colinaster equi]
MKTFFGKTAKGEEVNKYILENKNGVVVEVLDYGAILHAVYVPDKNGKKEDVTLSCPTVEAYKEDTCFFGSTVGPSANRIAKAECEIDGVKYTLDKNDGENNLHTDIPNGLNKRMWSAKEGTNAVTFTTTMVDGEYGLPGNREVSVTYSLSEDNELKIEYLAHSDKNTIFNMTNHSYFNLGGHKSGSALGHELQILASKTTPVGAGTIPTGEIASVVGTALDFTSPKAVGADIEADNDQMKLVNGYDFNYVVDNYDGSMKKIAVLKDPASGRCMEVYTDLPGVQFYSANWVEHVAGKDGAIYDPRYGLCLETQYYPDSVHHDNFCDVVFGPKREYHTSTVYKFV